MTAGQVISIADINAGKLTFRLQPGGSGNGSFTFQVHDNGGTAAGGVDTDQSPNTLTFHATAPAGAAVADGGHADAATSGVGDLSFAAVAVGTDSHLAGLKLDIDHVGGNALTLAAVAVDNLNVNIGVTIDQLSGHDLFAGQNGEGGDLTLAADLEQMFHMSHVQTATDFAYA